MKTSFLARVQARLHDFSVSERRLGDAVIEFPGNIASYSASELAKLANVSNATVTRFFRRLGYSSYEDARRQVRAESEAGSPLFASARSTPPGTIGDHQRQMQANLEQTLGRMSVEQLDGIADALVAARRLWIVGFRNGYGLALHMKWQLGQVLDNAVVLPLPGEALAESLASVKVDDVVLVFALRREHALQEACIRQARAAKAKIICVTNLSSRESWRGIMVLRCETRSRGPIDNHVSVLALGHLIVTRLFERSGRDGRRRLAAIETAHQNFRELAQDGSAGLQAKRGR